MRQRLLPIAAFMALITVYIFILDPLGGGRHDASTASPPNYLGWFSAIATALLASVGLCLKWKESRRADRAETREIHDRKQRGDDVR